MNDLIEQYADYAWSGLFFVLNVVKGIIGLPFFLIGFTYEKIDDYLIQKRLEGREQAINTELIKLRISKKGERQ
jgi:hypothetical protein